MNSQEMILTHEDVNALVVISQKQAAKLWSKLIKKDSGCWEWTGCRFVSQYGKIGISGKQCRSNRVFYTITRGQIPPGLNVCHHCDNPPCCNPEHLFLGTDKDNTEDMVSKGRANRAYGINSGMAKLTDDIVRKARILRGDGWTYKQIGDHIGVTRMVAWNAVNRKTWKRVA